MSDNEDRLIQPPVDEIDEIEASERSLKMRSAVKIFKKGKMCI